MDSSFHFHFLSSFIPSIHSPFLIPAWTPLFTFTFFHLLFLPFTLLLWVLLVPVRQLLANPPVAKHPAADSNLWRHMITLELGLVHQSRKTFLGWVHQSCSLENMLR